MRAIFNKEIRTLLFNWFGWILYAVYLLISALFLFWFKGDYNILESGIASLFLYFKINSYLLLLFIPGVTMRLLSEEAKTGNMEVLKTLPIPMTNIVFGKWLAAFTYALGFLLMLPLVYGMVSHLSQPVGNFDAPVVISSFLGIMLEIAFLTALGLFFSSMTENSTVAFFASVLTGFIMVIGLYALAQFSLLGGIDYYLQSLSLEFYLELFFKGIISVSGVIYMLLLTMLFLFFTIKKVEKA